MEKACIQFIKLDGGSRNTAGTYHVEFNPMDLQISTTMGKTKTKQNFQVGSNGPAGQTYADDNSKGSISVSVKLVFDGEQVKKHTEAFIGAARNPLKRLISFNWNEISFEGLLENVSVEYTMFDEKGFPKRANVNITISCEKI